MKHMLIELILKYITPSTVMLSNDLQSTLDEIISGTDFIFTSFPVNVAQTLKFVMAELNGISKSNLKLNDKLNHINVSTSSCTSYTSQVSGISGLRVGLQAASSVLYMCSLKCIFGTNHKSSFSLFVAPVIKFTDDFVSRF